ncbi:MAG: cellulase family glycosylhydrolase [Capsulimonadaceae bacterium]|nr:cellulase family glycosylhydrolase [Capsulimonadaceae bacterium]
MKLLRVITLPFAAILMASLSYGFPAPLSADGLSSPGIPQSCGVNIHYRPIPDSILPRLGDTGYGYARTDFKWDQIEKQPGVYDFSTWDKMTAQLASIGCKPLYTMTYGNPIYDPDAVAHAAIKGPYAPPRTPQAVAAYARFAAAAAAHFRGRGVIWEIWNEPDGVTFWKPTPSADEYTTMALEAAKEMRQADPSATILAPGLAGYNVPYLRTVLKSGILKYIDAVSWHPYRHSAPETVAAQYDSMSKIIAQYTPPGAPIRPIIASEWGYATTAKWNCSEDAQARYLVREWLANMAMGVDLTIFYDWRDDGKDPADQEANFGTLHNDFSLKPSGAAAKQLISTLNGYQFAHRLASASPTDWRLLFRKGQSLAVVAWSNALTATDAEATPSIRLVASTDPDYRNLLRAAAVDYHAGLVAFTTLAPARPAITVTNVESVPARVVLTLGSTTTTLTLAPGATKAFTAALFDKMPLGQSLEAPVKVIWNGEPVTDLPNIRAAATDLVDVTLNPRTDGFQVVAQSFVMPFHGALKITTPAGAKRVPVDFNAFETKTLFVPGNPETTVQVSLIDEKDRIIAQLPKTRYVLLPGMPRTASDTGGFDIVPCPMNIPATPAPANVVPAGPDAPSPYAIEYPYKIAPTWLYTLLKPHATLQIPDDATEIVLWIKSTVDNCGLGSRYLDATKQTFQPGLGRTDTEGWRAVHLTLRTQVYSWGGASDGLQHLPLRLDSLVNVDSPHVPDSSGRALVGPAYYALNVAN